MFNRIFPSATFPADTLLYADGFGPSDRYKYTAFTYTATAASTKRHNGQGITYNATTTKVDCGSQIVGTGSITLLCWVNATSAGEGNVGRIVDNGKFWVRTSNTNPPITVTSDGATEVSSANNSLPTGTEKFVAVTRTAAGAVNIYINGVLSGSADQASGTPANGSTNLIIGNNNAAGATWDGTIHNVRIFNKILTVSQIGQIYNLEV